MPGKVFSPMQLAQLIGRNQGPELFFQQPFTALTAPIIPRAVNLNRPWRTLHLMWRGRVVIAGANYTAVAAEAPQTIIERVRLTGKHAKYNALVPIDQSGATIFAWNRMFKQRGSSCYINGVRQPELGVPNAQVGATFGNIGTYDIELHYRYSLVPMFPPNPQSLAASVPFLYRQEDWGDTLQLQVFFGDQTSFGTPAGGTTVTFTAFGSGAGSPTLTILQDFDILGPAAGEFDPGVVIRNSQNITAGLTGIVNNTRIQTLQKQKTLNIVFKSGLLLAGTSSGINVFASLADNMLDVTQPVVDNKPIRENFSNPAAKEFWGDRWNTVLPGGYNGFTFVDSQVPWTMYRGDQVPGGSTFELVTNVLTANAQNAVELTQEMAVGDLGLGK